MYLSWQNLFKKHIEIKKAPRLSTGSPWETPIKGRYSQLGRDADFDLGDSVIVHYNNADLLEDYPAKAELLRIVRWKDSDVLSDRESTNSVGRSSHQDGLSVKLGADMDVSGPEVTIKTSGENLASSSLIIECLTKSTERRVLIGVTNNLGSNEIVLLNEAVGSIE